MALINQYPSIALERTGGFAMPRCLWRAQCRPFTLQNMHFRYPAVTRDPIARADGRVAPSGAR
jgi:hypothetical protein